MASIFNFFNRARKRPANRITAGGNFRPGTVTVTAPLRAASVWGWRISCPPYARRRMSISPAA